MWKEYIDAHDILRLSIHRSRTRQWREFCSKMHNHDTSKANMVIKRMRRNRQCPTSFSHPLGPAHATETMITHLAAVFGGEDNDPL